MNLISQLLNNDSIFSPTESVIVKYILEHPDDIGNLTIVELAKLTNTSNPAIIRLCKKLDVDGFRNFKTKFMSDLEKFRRQKTDINVNYPFKMYENALEVANNIALLTKTTIDACYQEMNLNTLNQVSQLISDSNTIYVFSVGDSNIRTLSFKNKLLKIGKNIIDTSSRGEEAAYSSFSTSKDCAIFITYSGSNVKYQYYARLLKQNNTPIITITAKADTKLAKLSNHVITFPDLENPIDNIATFYSQTAIEYILNTIYSLVYSLQYHKNRQKKLLADRNNHIL